MSKSKTPSRRENWCHVAPEARPELERRPRERILAFKQDRYVPYSAAEKILQQIEEIIAAPCHARMKGLFIQGESNCGKSVILTEIQARYPAQSNGSGPCAFMPVIRMQAPPSPNEAAVYAGILKAYKVPGYSGTIPERRDQVTANLQRCQTRILLIDELHNLGTAGKKSYEHILNALRFILNDTPLALVTAGTKKAASIIKSDDQLKNRSRRVKLPEWYSGQNGDEFEKLLDGFESAYPLKKRSEFDDEAVQDYISKQCDGTIGSIFEYLKQCAEAAVATGAESITLSLLKKVKYRKPEDEWKE